MRAEEAEGLGGSPGFGLFGDDAAAGGAVRGGIVAGRAGEAGAGFFAVPGPSPALACPGPPGLSGWAPAMTSIPTRTMDG